MITFKKNTALLFILLFVASAFAQETEKTLVKSFNIENVQEVTLDLKGEVEVKYWNNKLVRVQMNIALQNGSVPMLKSLVTNGRYNLVSKTEGAIFTIHAPNMVREIVVRGESLQENVTYTVFAPENVSIKLVSDASTSKESEKDSNSL